jgi:hypothetical protein
VIQRTGKAKKFETVVATTTMPLGSRSETAAAIVVEIEVEIEAEIEAETAGETVADMVATRMIGVTADPAAIAEAVAAAVGAVSFVGKSASSAPRNRWPTTRFRTRLDGSLQSAARFFLGGLPVPAQSTSGRLRVR